MRTPTRKPGKYSGLKADARITREKYSELEKDLARLKGVVRPRAIAEVKRLALDGDFSENAAYSIAKGRLRGINRRIDETEDLLRRSEIISPPLDSGRAVPGSRVTVGMSGQVRSWLILGSAETDPSRGVISANSPIGAAVLGKSAGDEAELEIKGKRTVIKIIKIE